MTGSPNATLPLANPSETHITDIRNSYRHASLTATSTHDCGRELSRSPSAVTLAGSPSVQGSAYSRLSPTATLIPRSSPAAQKFEYDGPSVESSSPDSAEEQVHQRSDALARMLANDPAPSWRYWRRGRSRTGRRRAVDGGEQLNGSGLNRRTEASPAPTTTSTQAGSLSTAASTLPPQYARYD